MSIDIDRFEEGDPEEWEAPTNAERVIAFLAAHDDRAWKGAEIARQTDIPRGSVGPVLVRLRERNLLRHRGEYWTITDDRERIEAAFDLHRITTTLDERYGAEARSEWIEHAADPPEE